MNYKFGRDTTYYTFQILKLSTHTRQKFQSRLLIDSTHYMSRRENRSYEWLWNKTHPGDAQRLSTVRAAVHAEAPGRSAPEDDSSAGRRRAHGSGVLQSARSCHRRPSPMMSRSRASSSINRVPLIDSHAHSVLLAHALVVLFHFIPREFWLLSTTGRRSLLDSCFFSYPGINKTTTVPSSDTSANLSPWQFHPQRAHPHSQLARSCWQWAYRA